MYSIENQYLKVVVSSLGAELQNIFDKEMITFALPLHA